MLRENGGERGVLGDASQCDVRDGFIDESARDTILFVLEFEIVETARQEALTCQGNRYTAGVNGYPPSAPTLRDVGGGAGATSGIEDEIAGVGGHEETAFDNFVSCLDDIYLRISAALNPTDICPYIICW